MINKFYQKVLISGLSLMLILPLDVDAFAKARPTVYATEDIGAGKTKKVNTESITKIWYRPRANKREYQREKLSGKNKTYNGKRIIISEKGKHYEFKRFAFLADGKPKKMKYYKTGILKKNSEVQGVAIIGKNSKAKMYILVTNRRSGKNTNHRYGHILKYNLHTLNKYVNKKGKHDKIVRALVKSRKYMYTTSASKSKKKHLRNKAKDKLTPTNYKIYRSVTIGPRFKAGHGQSFAYNPYDKYLYNAAYWLKKDTGKKHLVTMQRIGLNKLKPVKRWKFYIRIKKKAWHQIWGVKFRWPFQDKNAGYLQIRDLTFDKNGNFYFAKLLGRNKLKKRKRLAIVKPNKHESKYANQMGKKVQVYRGRLSSHSVKISAVHQISNSIGSVSQGLSYRKKGNRLFFIYDSAFMSLPLSKINQKFSRKSMHFTVLTRQYYRESEGMGITSDGDGYLIMNRYAEAVKSVGKVR
ncbi:hypothetical protein ACFQ44_01300 [Levilactobacillus lanxiensis]|uniref:GW domain-containing protein n=1 Tax=Levilactobacillus lanxiensis TaxID=2799568 RepID=A0ABW4D2H8_9LACO|nr:hypothetical protein [Levilactobacillus lanxiensis]